jgi:HprK-related kinase A
VKVHSIAIEDFRKALRNGSFRYEIGPFTVQLQTRLIHLGEFIFRFYGDCVVAKAPSIADFHVRVEQPKNFRRWIRKQVMFTVDGQTPFAPFPLDTTVPFYEWGINWCIATRAQHYLMLHAAVVEKYGRALLLPAWPGSGKSTLCAALMLRGWRLFSDEFGLVKLLENQLIPLPRCIPLKNESIEVIKRFAPEATLGPVFPKTRKGKVAHLRPPPDSVERAHEPAKAACIIFPHYDPHENCTLNVLSKPRAFMKLSGNSFNYELHHEVGFKTVSAIIKSCECYILKYNDLDEAISIINDMVDRRL